MNTLLSHISVDKYERELGRYRRHTDSELMMFALAELLHAMPDGKKEAKTVALQEILLHRAHRAPSPPEATAPA